MKLLRQRKGQATIEFAVILIMMVSLIFGVVEFGRIHIATLDVTMAAWEGARSGIISKTPAQTAEVKARQYLNANMKTGSGPAPLIVAQAPNGVGPGKPLEVTISLQMPTLFPPIFNGKTSVTIQKTMIMLQEDV